VRSSPTVLDIQPRMTAARLPKTMLAWQKHVPSTTLVRVEVPVPVPQDDEVLVKLHAAGVCHSDVALREMKALPAMFKNVTEKFTLGHEGSGEVVSTGSAVTNFKLGDMVAVLCVPGCGKSTCAECTGDVSQLCVQGPRYGIGRDGYFAPYVVVTELALLKLPTGVSPAQGAVATDACLTAYHAVTGRGHVKKGDTVLLFGLGGLGFNALQIILSIGARVVVVDQRQMVLDEALKLGVQDDDIVPLGTASVSDWIREKGLRVDTAIDFVAMPETFETAVESVRLGGTIVLVGMLSPTLTLNVPSIVRKQINVLGSYGGTRTDLKACLELIANGNLAPRVVTGSLADLPKVLDDLHEGKVKGRIVLIPEGVEDDQKN